MLYHYYISGCHVKWYCNCTVPILGASTSCARTLVLQKDFIDGKASVLLDLFYFILFYFYYPYCPQLHQDQHAVSVLQVCYFFYKNLAFGFTLFLYEAYASFSGQPAYNDWYMSLYNVFFTSLPVIALGVFDQDISARFCLKVCSPFSILHLKLCFYQNKRT